MSTSKLRIAVLYGGDSSEREVSIESGDAVAIALDRRGHRVRPIDVRNRSLEPLDRIECDLAFLAMHGAFGEDGQLQTQLEVRGLPYTGSGPEASRLAMDKQASKERFVECGIPTPPYTVIREQQSREAWRAESLQMGYPQIIKPAREGSSVAVSLVRDPVEAIEALDRCFELDCRALIEQRIVGRELTVAVLGHCALPIIELTYPGELFDYDAKYASGRARHVVNPELPPGVDDQVRAVALAAHDALGCRDLSRVDLFLDPLGDLNVLEVNTVPGMTGTSLVPEAAQAAGVGFPELCETIAGLSLKRAAHARALKRGA
jgi:D-alanine-D-alanine ligase